ncbi:MAG TPA: response regulator [Anaerolineales bacterium]|jgi:DNA-binding response OmpR family regulator|nr:response regulator [Anaerolineales bacterium]
MDSSQGYLLVVEDIPDILKLLEATLTFKGHRVVTARNGEEAMDAIERERPSLVITDILMPKMDGFSLVHRLRIKPETRDIPVVFLSATYVAPEDKAFALTIGVSRFIEKPVAMDKFVPIIEKILKQGPYTTTQPINEFEFYDGYRKRLEIKLNQKNIQIARDERLLDSLSNEEKPSFQISLQQAKSEREEIKLLLDQIREQLEKFPKAE